MIDLNGPGSYLDWGWVHVSWANAVVILLMIVAFVLALVLPFPGHGSKDGR
jgi:membrane protein YqaA with SNARE-associated domain